MSTGTSISQPLFGVKLNLEIELKLAFCWYMGILWRTCFIRLPSWRNPSYTDDEENRLHKSVGGHLVNRKSHADCEHQQEQGGQRRWKEQESKREGECQSAWRRMLVAMAASGLRKVGCDGRMQPKGCRSQPLSLAPSMTSSRVAKVSTFYKMNSV